MKMCSELLVKSRYHRLFDLFESMLPSLKQNDVDYQLIQYLLWSGVYRRVYMTLGDGVMSLLKEMRNGSFKLSMEEDIRSLE